MIDDILQTLRLHIDRHIRNSVKVNGKVYNETQIADSYINGELILKTQAVKITSSKEIFRSNLVDDDNYLCYAELHILKNLIRSYENTENALYLAKAKEFLCCFLDAVQHDNSVIASNKIKSFNRTLSIAYVYLHLYKVNDQMTENVLLYFKELASIKRNYTHMSPSL